MSEILEKKKVGNFIISVTHDECWDGGSREWDNLGTIASGLSNYGVGNSDYQLSGDDTSWKDLQRIIIDNNLASCGEYQKDGYDEYGMEHEYQLYSSWVNEFMIYSYDAHVHGSVALSSISRIAYDDTDERSFSWDSGFGGYIFVHKDTVKQAFGVKRITKSIEDKVFERLSNEIKMYNQDLNGEVYRFESENTITGDFDSCGGFYSESDAIDCAMGEVLATIALRQSKRNDRLKELIKNKVPMKYRALSLAAFDF